MNKNTIEQITNLSKEDLAILLKQKSNLFSPEELQVARERYNEICIENDGHKDDTISYSQRISSELRKYSLGELDKHVNTRILLGIYKKINFISNVILIGLICGGVAIVISLLK